MANNDGYSPVYKRLQFDVENPLMYVYPRVTGLYPPNLTELFPTGVYHGSLRTQMHIHPSRKNEAWKSDLQSSCVWKFTDLPK